MRMINNKKGIVFTIIAIALAVFFTLVFSARIDKPLDYKTEILETRVSLLSDYANTFFDYAGEVTSIVGYSALEGVIANISMARQYNPDFESQFVYCVRTGNLTTGSRCLNMTNKTLVYYLNQLKTIASNDLNINSTYILNNVSVNQTREDAFSIEITINLSLNVIDAYANISGTRILKSKVPIQGLLDPLYLLNGTYNQTILAYYKPESNWSYTDLEQLYHTRAYRWNKGAGISFIDRIKGNLSVIDSYYGIESFVNYTDVTYDENDTMVDYLFWQSITFSCVPDTNTEVIGVNDSTSFPLKNGLQYFQLDAVHATGFFIPGGYVVYPCS
jgi:hypothetical protein